MTILVTGTAGFIGYHTAEALLARGESVVGLDIVNDYYDPALKEARLARLAGRAGFVEARVDIADRPGLEAVFARHRPRGVIHLAAQAGVRYSVENPHAYVGSNLVGFLNILECSRQGRVEHLVYASTSSVYGANAALPFSEQHGVGHPMSLYAATKRANEVMAHSYAHLYGLPCTGLRFFTVYGPWGRPDMALFKFTRAILSGEAIDVYNNGDMRRDFTYIDDIVEGVVRVFDRPARPDGAWNPASEHPDPGASGIAPFRIYNIGRGSPVPLMDFIRVLEDKLGRRALCNMLPMQPGDVAATFADTSALARDTGYAPSTSVETGVGRFVDWYREYYGV
ncbi:capsular biosynthesis protein CpsI [Chelatococcus sp. CO-6]|uniref:NAD-dependent epimerase n=1 Tax=Chelatococcus sp. CO-6 TaxID=1702325 RepID=UPI00069E0497|nr:NAD-dependent epimerase [Chelatococcus sp. CO-6]ALA16725.1 capsular biosynthesis protein CpsI [Chelatococcus sp. CO-6]